MRFYHYKTTKTFEKRKATALKKKLGTLININTDYMVGNLKADTEYEFTIDAYHESAKDYVDSKIPNLKWINKSLE